MCDARRGQPRLMRQPSCRELYLALSLLRTDESELSADDADDDAAEDATDNSEEAADKAAGIVVYRIWTLRGDAHELIVDVDSVVLALMLVVVKTCGEADVAARKETTNCKVTTASCGESILLGLEL